MAYQFPYRLTIQKKRKHEDIVDNDCQSTPAKEGAFSDCGQGTQIDNSGSYDPNNESKRCKNKVAATVRKFTASQSFTVTKPTTQNVTGLDCNNSAAVDELTEKIDKILKIISTKQVSGSDKPEVSKFVNDLPANDSTNLQDFLAVNSDFEITESGGLKILTCKLCSECLSAPSCSRKKNKAERLPTSSPKGSLCDGLCLEDEEYTSYVSGKNVKWHHFKKTLLDHISGKTSKTHRDAVQHHQFQKPLRKREIVLY